MANYRFTHLERPEVDLASSDWASIASDERVWTAFVVVGIFGPYYIPWHASAVTVGTMVGILAAITGLGLFLSVADRVLITQYRRLNDLLWPAVWSSLLVPAIKLGHGTNALAPTVEQSLGMAASVLLTFLFFRLTYHSFSELWRNTKAALDAPRPPARTPSPSK